ncbi:MAG: flavin reductase family protein [Saprospiraceae bacterium]
MIIDPKAIPTKDLHQFILGCVAPRPIAWVSTVNKAGKPNLAPFSFFNAFSSNPPIVIFSSNRRVEDNTTKHTLQNVLDTKECVINMVSHELVGQMAICSMDYPEGVSEFEKAGVTGIAADLVKPLRVLEAPASLECKVTEVLPLGSGGGAGNLIVCEVLRIHIQDDRLDANGRPDPYKMDLMARMGKMYYARTNGDAIMTLVQPVKPIAIGFNLLPESVRVSKVLSGNDIARLAGNLLEMPTVVEMSNYKKSRPEIEAMLHQAGSFTIMQEHAKEQIQLGELKEAMMTLMLADGSCL